MLEVTINIFLLVKDQNAEMNYWDVKIKTIQGIKQFSFEKIGQSEVKSFYYLAG